MKYAYWRAHDGSIYKKGDGKHAPAALLDQIGRAVGINPTGGPTWPSFQFLHHQASIYPSVAIIGPNKQELNETDSYQIVKSALNEEIIRLGGKTPIQPADLLKLVNQKAKAFFRGDAKPRLLITSLSINEFPSSPIMLDGAEIRTVDRANFPFPADLVQHPGFLSEHIIETKYKAVAISTNQISVHQAFEVGMNTLNYLRGVWNLQATYKRRSMDFNVIPQRKWMADIHLGPLHTLHDEKNKRAEMPWWYEPDYVEDAECFDPPYGWQDFEEKRIKATNAIESLPYKNDMKRLLVRYALALDQANLDVTFLMLWGLLEKITDSVGKNYDLTIKRAVWGYRDRAIAKEMLNQMRWRRNRFVHTGSSTADRDQLCYITKSFVDSHLVYLIRNTYKLKSIKEYAEFLSLPNSTKRLSQMQEWLETALQLFPIPKPDAEESSG